MNSILHKITLIFILFILKEISGFSQYSPAGGIAGSDAIYKTDTCFKEWANSCSVIRGYIEIGDTSLTTTEDTVTSNRAFYGTPENVIGQPQGMLHVVSLGDGGSAVVTFETPISDGEGPDFAVFENGFAESTPPYLYFLELGFVEVSTDGQRYVRFPAVSLTQTDTQVASFGQLDPTKIYNLAGKYTADYGTPFDLQELADSSGIDIHNIQYVRIVDVVGSIDPRYGTLDSKGNLINDPYPTPFWDGGFDLQAVGVIHMKGKIASLCTAKNENWELYPNPVRQGESFYLKQTLNNQEITQITISDLSGKNLYNNVQIRDNSFILLPLSQGMYIISAQNGNNHFCGKLIIME